MQLAYRRYTLLLCLALLSITAWGQGSSGYGTGLKISLNEDGSKYVRFITWHQFWITTSQIGGTNAPDMQLNYALRRSRFLAYAQINKRFLILTHFGLNTLTQAEMGALSPSNPGDPNPVGGRGFNGDFFMHDAWTEYTVVPGKLYIGGGLHYWNGVSRLTSQSTLNFMTLDAPLTNWFSLGTSDQFARHLGVYAKGQLGRLDYRFALNEGATRPLFRGSPDAEHDYTLYGNPERPGGGMITQGYVNWMFWDKESNLLPFYVGTYLGTKKVFNIGAGFYNHADATATYRNDTVDVVTSINNATSFGVDAFLDLPLGEKGANGAITAYAVYYNHNWGDNYSGGLRFAGTGSAFYGKLGYLLPKFSDKVRVQPYVATTVASLDAWKQRNPSNTTAMDLKIGSNFFLDGHHSKITLEYYLSNAYAPGSGISVGTQTPQADMAGTLRLQLMIYL
ncbi:MAG: hypothetical protein OHK0039_32380 [Bacteroidia bacterium]